MIQSIGNPWSTSLAGATPITHHSSLHKSLSKKNSSGITAEDFAEFTNNTGMSKSESEELFKSIDTSGDGILSAAELKRGFTKLADSLFDRYESENGTLTTSDIKDMARDLGLNADKFNSKINPNDQAEVSRAEFERNMRAVLNHFDRFQEKPGAGAAADKVYNQGYKVQIKETIKETLTYKRTSSSSTHANAPAANTAPATEATPTAEAEGDDFTLEFSASIEESISYIPNEGPLLTSPQKPTGLPENTLKSLGSSGIEIMSFLHSLINPKRILSLLDDSGSTDPNKPSGGSTSGNASGSSSAASSTNPAMSYSEKISAVLSYDANQRSASFSFSDVINARLNVVG